MAKVFICLGTNLGNRFMNLKQCIALIEQNCGKLIRQSAVYETQPWGSQSENNFLNQVIQISTSHSPEELMKVLLRIEKKLGRKRTDNRNADRIIDIDILFYDHLVIESDHLQIPHPRLQFRRFVLEPMLEIAPKFVHPGFNKSILKLHQELKDDLGVNIVKQPRYICVEGNIGSGKTTLAMAMAERYGAVFVAEQFEKNDLLPLFYEDPQTYAFSLEFSFLLARFQQLSDVFAKDPELVVSDYSIHKCLWFAKKNLSDKDFKLFEKQFKVISRQLPQPDLIIYLEAGVPLLRQNIRKRGRQFETKISSTYLSEVSKHYNAGLKNLNEIEVRRIKLQAYSNDTTSELISLLENSVFRIVRAE